MTRYTSVAQVWAGVDRPPFTREAAIRAKRAILHKFGRIDGKQVMRPARVIAETKVRRCWITSRENAGLSRGVERLVHDLSHDVYARRHPRARPHAAGHNHLEAEIAAWVVERGLHVPKGYDDSGVITAAEHEAYKARRVAHAKKMHAKAVTRLKRATTIEKKWRAKVRRLEARTK